jgi:hypothetical protein
MLRKLGDILEQADGGPAVLRDVLLGEDAEDDLRCRVGTGAYVRGVDAEVGRL